MRAWELLPQGGTKPGMTFLKELFAANRLRRFGAKLT
jgi:hypothetical protein